MKAEDGSFLQVTLTIISTYRFRSSLREGITVCDVNSSQQADPP